MGAVTAVAAFERTAACCAAGIAATAEVGRSATYGKERSPDLGSVPQEACHLGPYLGTYPAVDLGLVDDDASGLAEGCAAVPLVKGPYCSVVKMAGGKIAHPCFGPVSVASELSCRTGCQEC